MQKSYHEFQACFSSKRDLKWLEKGHSFTYLKRLIESDDQVINICSFGLMGFTMSLDCSNLDESLVTYPALISFVI